MKFNEYQYIQTLSAATDILDKITALKANDAVDQMAAAKIAVGEIASIKATESLVREDLITLNQQLSAKHQELKDLEALQRRDPMPEAFFEEQKREMLAGIKLMSSQITETTKSLDDLGKRKSALEGTAKLSKPNDSLNTSPAVTKEIHTMLQAKSVGISGQQLYDNFMTSMKNLVNQTFIHKDPQASEYLWKRIQHGQSGADLPFIHAELKTLQQSQNIDVTAAISVIEGRLGLQAPPKPTAPKPSGPLHTALGATSARPIPAPRSPASFLPSRPTSSSEGPPIPAPKPPKP